eukprot:XP_028345943.1 protein spinster homolog 1-like [Physeter catodon]
MASEPFIEYKPSKAALPPLPPSPSQSSAEDEPLVDEKGSQNMAKRRRLNVLKTRSLIMVNASAALDGCDDQLLPATFRALERDLNFHPSLLGYITLSQTMCLSLLCPLWGYLSDRHSRKWLLAFGTFSWGLTTTLLGLVSEFWQVTALRALNGVFLGSVGPISQSILADTAASRTLGFSFGLIQLCSCFGRLVGGVVTTSVALLDIGNVRGWRVCFFGVGSTSMFLGLIIAVLLEEIPRRKSRKRVIAEDSGGTGGTSVAEEGQMGVWAFFNRVFTQSLSTPSIVLVLLELAMLARIPMLVLAYKVTPRESTQFGAFFILALLVGVTSMSGVAVNRPILSNVVRPDHKGTVFAITVALEGSSAAILGAPLVGFLAESAFGYQRTSLLVKDMPERLRLRNANALAQSLFLLTVIPWCTSFLIYTFLHFTYERDQVVLDKVVREEYEKSPEDDDEDDAAGTSAGPPSLSSGSVVIPQLMATASSYTTEGDGGTGAPSTFPVEGDVGAAPESPPRQ